MIASTGEPGTVPAATSYAVGTLTARWARAAVGDRPTVLTAAGVWPLLALLASAATTPARAELHGALGIADTPDAPAGLLAGRELLDALDRTPGVSAALGLWTRPELTLHQEWLAQLAPGTHEPLTGDPEADRARMDAWAAHRTEGMVEHMPAPADAVLVLASALVVRTTWRTPFEETRIAPPAGPWAGRTLPALYREGVLADEVTVAVTPAGRLTMVRVDGDDGIDVHLLVGDEGTPGGEVLAAGVETLRGAHLTSPAHAPLWGGEGPGVTVATEPAWDPAPRLRLLTVPFTVNGEHDLLGHAREFGLASARDSSRGHFPGIAREPLAVSDARQSATATFGPLGFRAAAVTAVAMGYAGAAPMDPPHRAQVVTVRADRPFGFLAVHRSSGLVLAAGWVTQPAA